MTLNELHPVMTTAQRQRADALLDAVQNLKEEIVHRERELRHPELVEPLLASPRSGLNPAFNVDAESPAKGGDGVQPPTAEKF